MRFFEKATTQYVPWNKGKLTGQKPPLQLKHVWAIRTTLQLDGRIRDLALFNLAIDSKLRGCDVVSLRVEDVAPHGYAIDRASVRQKKTGRPVKFEISEQTRQAIDDYLQTKNKVPSDFLFTGRRANDRYLTTRQYARLVSEWVSTCWSGFILVWHAFDQANQGNAHLSQDRKPSGGATVTGAHKSRKYRQIPWH